MKIAGIVAEYNPIHNGHAFHIQQTKNVDGTCRATHVVAVMSGNFIQRGGPAVMPKADRVRAALACGVDLVLELPLPWAMASAEAFATGAVGVLDALGCVDDLSFGSECGDLRLLNKVVDALESERFSTLVRYYCDGGVSFPAARQKAVQEIAGERVAGLLELPNNTLGIEYIKAIRAINSEITPFTVARIGTPHDGMLPIGEFASASYLRELIMAGRLDTAMRFMPAEARAVLHRAMADGHAPADEKSAQRAVLAHLRRLSKVEISRLPGISEGLENRIYDSIRQCGNLQELYDFIKTKRYTMTRVRRIVWSGFLGLTADMALLPIPYIRVLGLNGRGEEILSVVKKSRKLPLLSRPSQLSALSEGARQVFETECRAADLYAMTVPVPFPCGSELTDGVIRV